MKGKIRKLQSVTRQRRAFPKCSLPKCILTAGVLTVSLLVLVSCQESKKNPAAPLEEQICQTPEFRDLESIRKTVLKIIVENRLTRHEYIRACTAGGAAAVADIIGMDGGEWGSLTARMTDDVNGLMNRFPGLRNLGKAQEKPGGLESISAFLDRYDQIVEKLSTAPDGLFKADARVGCAYGQYSTCLVLTGYGSLATGGAAPLVYAGGSYLCLCSYCSGGWVDWVCF